MRAIFLAKSSDFFVIKKQASKYLKWIKKLWKCVNFECKSVEKKKKQIKRKESKKLKEIEKNIRDERLKRHKRARNKIQI